MAETELTALVPVEIIVIVVAPPPPPEEVFTATIVADGHSVVVQR